MFHLLGRGPAREAIAHTSRDRQSCWSVVAHRNRGSKKASKAYRFGHVYVLYHFYIIFRAIIVVSCVPSVPSVLQQVCQLNLIQSINPLMPHVLHLLPLLHLLHVLHVDSVGWVDSMLIGLVDSVGWGISNESGSNSKFHSFG